MKVAVVPCSDALRHTASDPLVDSSSAQEIATLLMRWSIRAPLADCKTSRRTDVTASKSSTITAGRTLTSQLVLPPQKAFIGWPQPHSRATAVPAEQALHAACASQLSSAGLEIETRFAGATSRLTLPHWSMSTLGGGDGDGGRGGNGNAGGGGGADGSGRGGMAGGVGMASLSRRP